MLDGFQLHLDEHETLFYEVCSLRVCINPLNAKLNPIYHLLALLGTHHIFHVSGLRVNEMLVCWDF